MPITQQRMLSLITFAQDLLEQVENTKATSRDVVSKAEGSQITWEQCAMTLYSLIETINPNLVGAVNLAKEAEHFKTYMTTNERNKRAQRRRRGSEPDLAQGLDLGHVQENGHSQEYVPPSWLNELNDDLPQKGDF